MGFPRWEQATHCTDGPAPGALALAKWIMEEYGPRGAMNWGIYNCRTVRGGSTTSCHGEGRAFDSGFAVGDPDGDSLLRLLLRAPGRLGIQCLIYERRIYSAASPEGRPYTGVAPHWDHIHTELTRESARDLTYATVKRVMTNVIERSVRKPGSRDLREGDQGEDVAFVQKVVGAGADGVFGPMTRQAVLQWETEQARKYPRLKVDGVVGTFTWAIMGVTPTYRKK